MKFKSKILCILLLSVLIFSLSAVAANETTTQSFKEVSADSVSVSVETNDEILGISNSEESLGAPDDGTFKSLQEKINNTAEGDTLVLENDYANTDDFNQNGINISKSLTIDGNGYTIDALGKGRIFSINASNVILKNIKFINGYYSRDGGAVYWGGNNGSLINCTFVNNSASNGGAIYWYGENATLSGSIFINNSAGVGGAIRLITRHISIFDSKFINNNASTGGALSFIGDGGFVDVTEWILQNSTFINNSASYDGGAIYCRYLGDANVRAKILDSKFINNNASNSGGVVYLYKSREENKVVLEINGSEFEGNNATDGGAIYSREYTNVDILNTKFINNNAVSSSYNRGIGGALLLVGNGTVSNSIFVNNSATGSAGAVFLNDTDGIVSGSTFINNSATDHGGAVFLASAISWSGNGAILDSTFINNSATGSGGAVSWGGANGRLSGSTFINNSASSGGAVYWSGSNGTILDSKFINNNASHGGAVDWRGVNGTILDSKFINNNASSGGAIYQINILLPVHSFFLTLNSTFVNNSASSGGAIYSLNDLRRSFLSHVKILDSKFMNNTASAFGGATYLRSNLYGKNLLEINGSEFDGNNATDGGAIYSTEYTNFNILNSNFTNNNALPNSSSMSGLGGAVFLNGNGTVLNSTFVNNSAEYGGAVFWNRADGNLTSSSFINNSAYYGGAVYWSGADGRLSGSTFIGNNASYGGAVEWDQYATNGTLSGSTFIGNSASSAGGAVSWNGDNGTLSGSNFTGNNAFFAGAVSCAYIGFIISNSSFVDCSSRINGGAITTISPYTIISNCGFENCSVMVAPSIMGGGAIYMWGGSISDCTFVNSSTNSRGGAIHSHDDSVSVDNCSFVDCSAKYGGAVYFHELTSNGVLGNCSFVDCSAQSGGAVYWNGANGRLSGSTFTGNNATDGGAVYWNGDNGVLGNCSFVDCSAYTAGAVCWSGDNGNLSCSNFTNNSAVENGGAVWLSGDNVTLSGSSFTGNSANAGGAVYWNATNGNLTGSSFTGNSAGFGGAVFWAQYATNGTLTGSSFDYNSGDNGGAVRWDGADGSLTGSSFTGNSARFGGAVFWTEHATNGNLTRSSFINNSAVIGAGAVNWNAANGTLSGSNFTGNNASVGGAVIWTATDGVLSGSSFDYNSGDNGGAVRWDGDRGILRGSNFTGNNASSGGAVYWDGASGVLDNSSFDYNSAPHGGAVYWNALNGNLTGSNFTGNNASSGGAVYWSGDNGTLVYSSFVDCSAYDFGGAVYWQGADGVLGDCSFVDCSVNNTSLYSYGGAVYWPGNRGSIYNSSFIGSYAMYGGAVHWYGNKGFLVNSSFIGNSSKKSWKGGAVYWSGAEGVIEKSSFVNNSAEYGGTVYREYYDGVINDSSFVNNSAEFAGAIYWSKSIYNLNHGGACQVINSSFINNSASYGGAVHFWDINVNVNNSYFKNNSAKYAGAIDVRTSNMTVDNSNFTSNYASHGGGAIGNSGDYSLQLNVEINNSNFDNNHANNYGGALSLDSVLVDNSNFNNNSAVFGGAIYSISPTVKNSKFKNNKALELGNSIFAINKASIENSNINNDIYENNLTEFIFYDDKGGFPYEITYGGKTYDAFSIELLFMSNGNNEPYVVDPSLKLARNVVDSSDVSDYVKSLLYKYFKGQLSYDVVSFMIKSAVYGNSLMNVNYNAPDVEYIGNNMVVVYEYISLITPSSNQNLVFIKPTYHVLNQTLTKEALNKTAFVGDIVKFRINVTNGNYFTLPDVFVKDVFNDGEFEYVSFESEDNWSYNINSKVFTLKSLSPSNTSSIILSFKVKTNGTLTNIAVSGIGENETGNNNTTITVYTPELSIEKVSLTSTVVLGQTARFEIIVKNNGDSDLHNVIVTENPSQGLVFDSYDSTGLWKYSIVNNKHVWTLVNPLTPGSSVSLFVNFKTTALGRLVNYADIESDETNKSTTGEAVDVIKPEIKVEKIVLKPNVSLGEQAGYEIVIHNIGDADLTNIVVEEMPDASLVFDHYVDNGLFTHSFVNGKHIWTLDKLSKGTYAGFFVYFNTTASGNISNKISVKSDEIPENTTISNNTNVLIPTFSVEKICLVPNVLVGNQTQFQIVIKNTGKIELTNVYFTEESFNGLIYDGAIGEGIWTYKFENGKHTWTLNEALEADEFAVLILRFNTTAKGNFTNFVSAGANQTGVLIANATVHVFENELPDPVENSSDDYKMDVFKTVVTQEVVLGGQITFQIVVHNTGNKNLENVKITEILPDGLIYSHFVDYLDLWTYNGDLTWSATRAILSGEYVSFFVTFNTTKPGKFENHITVTADKANATAGNTSFEILNPDFTIEKILVEDNIANGGQATFEIVIHNTGNAPLTNLTVREYFFDGLVYDHFVDYGGLWSYIGDLTWTMNSKLAPGEYVGFFVTFNTTKDGKFINIVVANSTECGNKFSNNATVSVHNETVDIRMISLTPLVIMGNQVTFEITVQNTGKINISALKISEFDFEGLIYDYYMDYLGHWINDGITWTLNTTLVPGEVTSLFVVFNTTRVGNFTNIILVNNDVLDTNELLSANSLDEGIYVSAGVEVVKPEYTIEKVALNKTANIGDEIVYEIIVHNTGKVNITNITVRDIPSDGLEYLRFIDSENFWSKNSDLSWNLIGNLVPGQYSIFYVVFNATKAGNLENTLESDNLTSKTTVEVKDPVEPTNPGLTINVEVITDPITGQPVLKVTVTNIGNVDLDNVFVKPNMPQGLKYGNYYSYDSIWNLNNDEFALEGLLKVSESKSFFIEILGNPGDYQIKIDAGYNGTIADSKVVSVKVLDNSTPGNITPEVPKDNAKQLKSSVAAGDNATGNPILMILLVLIALALTRFRKKD